MDKSNGLYKATEVNGIQIELVYKPSDLILAQEIEGIGYSISGIDSIKRKLKGLAYFTLRLSRDGQEVINAFVNDVEKYNKALNYLSFEIGKDLILVNEKDTIAAADFIHMRTFNASGSSDVLMAFKYPITQKSGKITILYNDSFFDTGLTKFDFNIRDIVSVPSINFNNIIL